MVHPKTEQHAIALLSAAKMWGWKITSHLQASGEMGGKYQAITSELLSAAIIESNKLGVNLFKSDPESIQPDMIVGALMQGLKPEEIDFSPVLNLAADVFTHLGVAFMNPGGAKSKSDTPFSVGELDRMETDALLAIINADGKFGYRKQAALKQLATKHDGKRVLVYQKTVQHSAAGFRESGLTGIGPIIPHSFHQKSDTLALISMFAGEKTMKGVVEHLNSIGNAMNVQSDAHTMYDKLWWGMEAQECDGKVKYVHRRVSRTVPKDPGPGFILLKDGDEIKFGQGCDGEKLGNGPLPLLCNLHLAVARIVLMSGAADIITQWMDEADDSDFPHVYLASDAFFKILTAKLQLVT
ncbi:hypothetical protein K439DRAFT_1664763 [Ramaria rubella]|nr:hypothetical protein K439DRAFT_1664763 [Ramaria rubella]